jgi:DNA-binding response OmpR family regulator
MKVLIADGSQMITERLTALMLEVPRVRLLAHAATGEAVLNSVRAYAPDILVMDARIASGDSRGFIAALRREKPSLVVIILSNLVDPLYRQHFESAGANLFLDKSNEFIHLRQFVRELVHCPDEKEGKARKDGMCKRIAHIKLRVGLQIGLFVLSAASLLVGPRARVAVPGLERGGGAVSPCARNAAILSEDKHR